jgi:hypothetical protein
MAATPERLSGVTAVKMSDDGSVAGCGDDKDSRKGHGLPVPMLLMLQPCGNSGDNGSMLIQPRLEHLATATRA